MSVASVASRQAKGKELFVSAVNLSTRSVVRFSGEGAEKLLNDTVTGRIDKNAVGEGRWFALLSPQGKILVDGLVTFAEDSFWADIEAGTVAEFIKRMKMYRMRAKVEIDDVSAQYRVDWNATPDAWPGGIIYRDLRQPGLGYRRISSWSEPVPTGDPSAYERARAAAAIAELGPDFGANETFAHDVGMDILGGIDFSKGCYIGQEVVSRMKHRGTARRRPVIVSGVDAPPGTTVIAGPREAGTIGQVVDGQAVAILRLDRITDPAAVTVDGRPVTLTLPVWATYAFGDTAPED